MKRSPRARVFRLPTTPRMADRFRLRVAGAGIVGSVTVSGLPHRADHELVVEALCASGSVLKN